VVSSRLNGVPDDCVLRASVVNNSDKLSHGIDDGTETEHFFSLSVLLPRLMPATQTDISNDE